MSNEITVYKQLTSNVDVCLSAIKREIGMKTTCAPFAVKIMEALGGLTVKTEDEQLLAANTLLSGLQTLMQGGIVAEDYDKIDLVQRGKTIVPSARVEAFYRAAARKGYRITDTIIAVPKEDKDTTYFKENFHNGDIIYTLEDRRYNPDREITAERLVQKYFSKFLCRLDIHDAKKNQRVAMTVCEMSIDDLLTIAAASEQGLYKSYWEKYKNEWGKEKNRKVVTEELNTGTFWVKWTGEMVNKTVIRRALKRVKEVLPELTDSIYAFEQDEYTESVENEEPKRIEIPVVEVQDIHVNMRKLTSEQIADGKECLELYKANPKLAEDKFEEIKKMIADGEEPQNIIDKEYPALFALHRSRAKWSEIGDYFYATDEN